jgi:predicted alpha/beta hydrolase family esterase
MGKDAILVGHSVGAAILLMMLLEDEMHARIGGALLIAAPFIGPGGWEIPGFALPQDSQEKIPAAVPLYFYHSEDDETVPITHARLYAHAFPRAVFRRVQGRNHQFNEDLRIVAEDIVVLEA